MDKISQPDTPDRENGDAAMDGGERFVDGLLRELARNPEETDTTFVHRVMRAVAAETGSAQKTLGAVEAASEHGFSSPQRPPRVSTFGWRQWIALSAAGVLLVLGFFNVQRLIRPIGVGLPTIGASGKGTQVIRDGIPVTSPGEFQLAIGDRIFVSADEGCVILQPGGTRLILEAGAEASLARTLMKDGVWQLDVTRGSIRCTPSGEQDAPTFVSSPHVMLAAVRSEFVLIVGATGSFLGNASGEIRLYSVDRKRFFDLKPGEYAAAGKDAFLKDGVLDKADLRSGFLTGSGVPERRERMKLRQMGLLVAALTWSGAERMLAAETAEKPAGIRSDGISLVPQKPLVAALTENAKAFYDHLATIAADGKVEHPKEPPPATDGMKRKSGGLMARNGGSAKAGASSGAVGVTTGGMQDIGQARKIISEGKVPTPEMFTPEGLLSEHDIPLEGWRTGESELYASASIAWSRRYGRQAPEAVVQIGFGVDMELDDFHRDPLNLAVVVDVSGSMGGGKIAAARKAVARLVDQLNDKDRLAIVLFDNTAWTPFPSDVMTADNRKQAQAIAEKLESRGGTSIEAGLKFGFEQVAAHLNEPGRSPRVLLFTDAQPNVGATQAEGFIPMTEGAAGHRIGLGAFGMGVDFGQELAYKIFQTRGGNYFFLEDEEKIEKVFDKEFDFMVTPAAYDVTIQLVPTKGAKVTDVLGVPDFEVGEEVVSMKIPTLFFSSREGGGATMVAMTLEGLKNDEETPVADVLLSFLPVGKEEKVQQRLDVFLPPGLDATGQIPYYSQPGAKKALLLAHACLALKGACKGQKALRPDEAVWTVPVAKRHQPAQPVITLDKKQAEAAAEGLGKFADWFAEQASGFPALEKELRLIEKLEETLINHAELPARKDARPFNVQAPEVGTAPPLWRADEF